MNVRIIVIDSVEFSDYKHSHTNGPLPLCRCTMDAMLYL